MIRQENKKESPKVYWFYVETYVHISIKKESLLLYNTYTGKTLEYSGESHGKVLSLVRRLQSRENLWVVRLTEKDLQDSVIADFVRTIRDCFMGDLLDTSYSKGRPIQTVPIVTIRKNARLLKIQGNRSVGENMMEYLSELSIHINSECRRDCGICSAAYRQFQCCTTEKSGNRELELLKIQVLLKQLAPGSLSKINILGGDILTYGKLEELIETLNIYPVNKTFIVQYENLSDKTNILRTLVPQSTILKIPVTFPIDKEKLLGALETVKTTGIDAAFTFILQEEAECEEAEALITSLQIPNYDFKPFFNGKNLDFFQRNVYFEKEEILDSKPSLREIYQNSEVNSLSFGRLTIFSNGHIHANVNAPRLGILGADSIYDVLYKELYHGRSWRRIRKNVAPCKGCNFNSLCPPLSNYVYAVGRNDLCFKGISQ